MEEKKITSVPGFVAGVVKVGDLLETALAVVGGAAVVAFVSAVFLDVAAREAHHPISWGQEIALFTYIWAIFMGSAIGVRHGTHFTIDLVLNQIKGGVRKWVDLFDHLVIFLFVAVLLYYGWQYALVCLNRFSQPTGICMTWGSACMVVGAVCMVYFCVEYFILALAGTDLAQYKAMGKEGDQ